jgi:hypothetical protein
MVLPNDSVFGFKASMVTTTICAGRVLMQDRRLLTLDEAAITARSRELAQTVWKRYEDILSSDSPRHSAPGHFYDALKTKR